MKHWIEAARVRTLPLSVSGILVGSFYALSKPTENVLTPTQVFSWTIFGLLMLTTIGLQVLSNFANDYGDGVKGTDNEDRIGPKRALQSGVISPAAMKRAIIITATLTFISAVLLIYVAFGLENFYYSLIFLVLGIVAIASAIRYTVGKNAYGYQGYGDIFVFFFFGLVSTYGSYFMFSKVIDWYLLLPAIAIGFLSVGVLNLNNMRDEFSDKKAGKNTIVVKIGGAKARQYHYFLVITAMLLLLVFGILQHFAIDQYIYLIVFLPIISHLLRVKRTVNPADLDPELKRLAISTFMVSLLLSLCLIYFISDIIV
ncbi:MAG TPA: 1,4-dihydroxy-2-naphthoate octaprenyltransferase [Flavobacterium sp.]|uniref:1,4-dihydroxy-2-naphthoate octaprenyltransferase n=1 Tax=unclassified Flavobacterium TaxID=196869 RepID=UPI000E99DDB4|nr:MULTISPECIES: 1,4-dihydroxy-2-naphthoate octaprenyltransferase [unclassified Flavobacterium]HBI00592.1 1,4-dihydroxy-2-naphthoate octaprenyltransferase [Flavobacterium sp.]HRE78138.1 1,4-dihydroxy-2-naphthoate octaprenyltransferase [Flavobacterium sp.]